LRAEGHAQTDLALEVRKAGKEDLNLEARKSESDQTPSSLLNSYLIPLRPAHSPPACGG